MTAAHAAGSERGAARTLELVLKMTSAVLLAILASACEPPAPPQTWAPPVTPAPQIAEVQQQLARPFVVFASAELEIDQIGEPVATPVQVGSRPSPATMASDAPDVVSVEVDGRLLARRAGRARLRAATGGPELVVTVRLASSDDRRSAARGRAFARTEVTP